MKYGFDKAREQIDLCTLWAIPLRHYGTPLTDKQCRELSATSMYSVDAIRDAFPSLGGFKPWQLDMILK